MRGEEGDALLFVSKPIRFNHLGLGEGFLSASRSESSSGSSSSAAFLTEDLEIIDDWRVSQATFKMII